MIAEPHTAGLDRLASRDIPVQSQSALRPPPVTMITERPMRANKARFLNAFGEIRSFCDWSNGTDYMLDEIILFYGGGPTAST